MKLPWCQASTGLDMVAPHAGARVETPRAFTVM